MDVYKSIIRGLEEALEYSKGNHSTGREVKVKKNENIETSSKLHINETNEIPIIESFEEFDFNPYNNWIVIYDAVIDPLTEKYWNSTNRKKVIENKVYDFYNKFKRYESVRIAYEKFLDSDRLFED